MDSVRIKISRRDFDVTNNDIVLFNGCAYICTTLKVRSGWNMVSPTMSNTQAKKLIKSGALELIEEHIDYVTADGRDMWYRTYKFNIEKLK